MKGLSYKKNPRRTDSLWSVMRCTLSCEERAVVSEIRRLHKRPLFLRPFWWQMSEIAISHQLTKLG
jgi:hypothetical protein